MTRERPSSGRPAALTLRAPAKVNLFLEVTARRPDGYHELRTLPVAVSLFDVLTFAPARGAIRLSCTDPALGAGPENLVVRAAEALRRYIGAKAGARIGLKKRIPVAAGLGGGSSDAATTLYALGSLWKAHLRREDLTELAARIGSDVAFFLGQPAAWCTGRGENVAPLRCSRLHLVLVCPPFGLSTAEVYSWVKVPAQPLSGAAMKKAVQAGDIEAIGRRLHNRLQEPALALRPELKDWLGRLKAQRPLGQLVSGSGSTVFALARDAADARRIAAGVRPAVKTAGGRVVVVRTL